MLSSGPKEAIETLTWCLEVVPGWMRTNKLNPDKAKILLVEPNSTLGSGTRPLPDIVLCLKVDVHGLEVLPDLALLLDVQEGQRPAEVGTPAASSGKDGLPVPNCIKSRLL